MRFDHIGLSVADLDAQERFYRDALDLTEVEERFAAPEAGIRTAILRSPGGMKLELIERQGSTPVHYADAFDAAASQTLGHLALSVDNLDQVYAALLETGATPISPPAPAVREGFRFAYVADPEGNLIELIQSAP